MTYICNLCPRRCNAVRTETVNIGGVCGMPYKLRLARASRHDWEEPVISGDKGSGTVFFSGCQLKCVYCQNKKISHDKFGKDISPRDLSEIFKKLEADGVHNINLVSATQFVPLIIEALDIYRPNIPIVFNSGGYESIVTLEALRGYVDIFLMDFKYWSEDKSSRYSSASDYPEVAKSAILKAYELVGPPLFEGDIMQKGVIIRHLLLPSSTKECISIMDWIKQSNKEFVFSLMNQYTVMDNLNHPEIARRVTHREYNKVLDYMMDIGLDGFVQDSESSSIDYIPPFDLTGV